MTELRVSHLLDEADELLDNKFHVGSYCLFMNTDDIQDILGKIRAILPEEIKTAEMILKRRDDIYMEAQSRADRIINEAQNTASHLLSESKLMRDAKEQIEKLQEQVRENCEQMKSSAVEESDAMRRNAYKEAAEIKDGAKAYAENVLNRLEAEINQAHKHIKQCQDYVAQQKNAARDYNQPKAIAER